MKTTLMIDDAVIRQAKERAAARGESLGSLTTEALRLYLQIQGQAASEITRFRMPVFGKQRRGGAGITVERIAEFRDDGR